MDEDVLIIFTPSLKKFLKPKPVSRIVDGRNSAPVAVGSLSHCLQSFIHRRWFSRRISEPSTVFLDTLSQEHFIQGKFQGPPIMEPPYGKLPIRFPYHSRISRDSYGSGMGIVWVRGPIIGGPWKSHPFISRVCTYETTWRSWMAQHHLW